MKATSKKFRSEIKRFFRHQGGRKNRDKGLTLVKLRSDFFGQRRGRKNKLIAAGIPF